MVHVCLFPQACLCVHVRVCVLLTCQSSRRLNLACPSPRLWPAPDSCRRPQSKIRWHVEHARVPSHAPETTHILFRAGTIHLSPDSLLSRYLGADSICNAFFLSIAIRYYDLLWFLLTLEHGKKLNHTLIGSFTLENN